MIAIAKQMQAATCSGQRIMVSRKLHHKLAVVSEIHRMKTEIRASDSQGKGMSGSRTSTKAMESNCEKMTSSSTGCMAQKFGRKKSVPPGFAGAWASVGFGD